MNILWQAKGFPTGCGLEASRYLHEVRGIEANQSCFQKSEGF